MAARLLRAMMTAAHVRFAAGCALAVGLALVLPLGDAAAFQPLQFLVSPVGLDFGGVGVDVGAATQVVLVTNVGSSAVVMSGLGGAVASPFNASQDCQGKTLAPGDSCHMFFDFKPAGTGSFSATSSGSWNGQSFTIGLAGEGVAPDLRIAEQAIDFGSVQQGTSTTLTSTITNIGGAPVVMSGLGGAVFPPFNAFQDCQGKTLAPGDSCHMYFEFDPTGAGSFGSTSSGSWNGESFNIKLTGRAFAPRFRISGTTLDFGQVEAGTSAPTQSSTVTNIGTAPVVMSGLGGAVFPPFNASQDCQGKTLHPGDSCHMFFDYAPTTTGTFSSTSSGSWNGQPFNITLTGEGIAPVDTTPPVLSLPSTIVVDATGPAGIAVTFAVSATDDIDPRPTVVCTPSSGSVFPIGTTTVNCTASDASGNTATGSFAVQVKGAPAQLADLAVAVKGVGPGKSLERKVSVAQRLVASGEIRTACPALTGFESEVQAQSGKSIPDARATDLIADAGRIKSVLACG